MMKKVWLTTHFNTSEEWNMTGKEPDKLAQRTADIVLLVPPG